MYVDLTLLLIMYVFSCIAVGLSIYALWTLKEIEEYYKKRSIKPKQRIPLPKVVAPKSKGHWD